MSDFYIIDFSKLGGPVYIGRSRGEMVRKKLDLEKIDNSDKKVKVIIPSTTFSVNSSFFLGLFGDSVKKCGNRENFMEKFIFECDEIFKEPIERGINRALQEKYNLID
jgi:hypothetical protein